MTRAPSNLGASPDILIVGAGPSGTALGMALAEVAPLLAERTLVIDRATHPREKCCGGGLTGRMQDELDRLGVSLEPVPQVIIRRAFSVYGTRRFEVALERPFIVIRRRELDAQLATTLRDRGVALSEGEAYVEHASLEDGRLAVRTTRGSYNVRALIAADGAGSKIARGLERTRRPKVHLCQADVPLGEGLDPEVMVYDFSELEGDLRGYLWIFPTPLPDPEGLGRPMANVGVMQVGPTRAGGGLVPILERMLSPYGMTLGATKPWFHPEWAFDWRYPFSQPGILAVGDAAGIDPVFGEGLSQCLEYAWLAAAELADGLSGGGTRFSGYRRRVLTSELGLELLTLQIGAHGLYGAADNRLWTRFTFRDAWLSELMARQGEGRALLHRSALPVGLRALRYLLGGLRGLGAPRGER